MDSEMNFIVVAGDIVDGFVHYGPFPTYEKAAEFAENALNEYSRVVELEVAEEAPYVSNEEYGDPE